MEEERRPGGAAAPDVGAHRVGHARLLPKRLLRALELIDLRRAGVADRVEADALRLRDRVDLRRIEDVGEIHPRLPARRLRNRLQILAVPLVVRRVEVTLARVVDLERRLVRGRLRIRKETAALACDPRRVRPVHSRPAFRRYGRQPLAASVDP